MAGLDPATQQARVRAREDSLRGVDTPVHTLALWTDGRLKVGHGEDWDWPSAANPFPLAAMCGKFVQMAAWEHSTTLAELIGSAGAGLTELVTPMRVASVIHLAPNGARDVARMRWGFVPAHAADANIGTQFIHARAETIEQKPTYRDAFLNRRGLVIVRSFNEGKEITPTRTEQHVIAARDGGPIALGVIWECWGRGPLESFAMVTTAANALIGSITDRMPAVIPPEHWAKWLGEEAATVEELKAILVPYEGDWEMEAAPRAKRPGPQKPQAQAELF